MDSLPINMAGRERVASVISAAALFAIPALRRRTLPTVFASAALLLRGATGRCPFYAAIDRVAPSDQTATAHRAVRLDDAVTVARPAAFVFGYWRDLTHLPVFMTHLERVEVLGGGRSHWVMRGPNHEQPEWDAEIVQDQPPTGLSWKSLPGADLASSGAVSFRPTASNETEVHVSLRFDPPWGRFRSAVAWLLGRSPKSQLHEDLRRLKQLLEAGEIPTVEGQASGRNVTPPRVARLPS